ncbi:hypothetical protein CK203_059136 [Vitis vinifera]|uniref:Uncharacterized protein n=1 Tax=Vitis vinifera TaxID=29760 RepID=A0A438GCH9_VITVI|nr:hypothetical protein CK203_059136 [Vitis vinifera]
MRDGGDFTIIVTRKEGVAAGQPMHEHWLPLSNLDLIFPPIDKAMVQALVPYNAFAGKVVGLCNNRGVDFMETYADAKVQDLRSWAEMAQCKSLSVVPSFQRSLLNIRCLGSYDPSLDDMYVPLSTLPPPRAPQPGGAHTSISRIYYVMTNSSVYSKH